eukprot:1455631-Pyramimonas_sp.AAC.1
MMTGQVMSILLCVLIAVAMAAGAFGSAVGRCCRARRADPTPRFPERTAEGEVFVNERVRARKAPGPVVVSQFWKCYHPDVECQGLCGASSKLMRCRPCALCCV